MYCVFLYILISLQEPHKVGIIPSLWTFFDEKMGVQRYYFALFRSVSYNFHPILCDYKHTLVLLYMP